MPVSLGVRALNPWPVPRRRAGTVQRVSPETRFARADELPAVWDVFVRSFDFPQDRFEEFVGRSGPERVLASFAGGRVVAGSRMVPFGQWFGGRRVPMAGYSPVAVAPEQRGRGLGRAVTVGQYENMRDRGEVAAGLFPSSPALYRSVGFELAGGYVDRRIPSHHLGAIRGGEDVVVRPGTADDVSAVRACYDRVAPTRHGHLDRPEEMWRRKVPADLAGLHLYVVDDVSTAAPVVAGYAAYRHQKTRPPYEYAVRLVELISEDPDVSAALWRVVGSSGTQAPHVFVTGPPDDPVFLRLPMADPRSVRSEIRWMIRLIDAAGAVAARGYRSSATARVELDIRDVDAPWNAGRWVLDVSEGSAELRPGGAGTVETTIGGLSSIWAGYASARTLATAGLMRSADPAALDALDEAFAGPAPVLADFY